jgi:hypothetical protein
MTRTDENAHYYYFTESLPHMHLTRVGLCVTSGNPRSLRPLLWGSGHKEDCCGWPSKPLSEFHRGMRRGPARNFFSPKCDQPIFDRNRMWHHFMHRHLNDKIIIDEEGEFPRCQLWTFWVTPANPQKHARVHHQGNREKATKRHAKRASGSTGCLFHDW